MENTWEEASDRLPNTNDNVQTRVFSQYNFLLFPYLWSVGRGVSLISMAAYVYYYRGDRDFLIMAFTLLRFTVFFLHNLFASSAVFVGLLFLCVLHSTPLIWVFVTFQVVVLTMLNVFAVPELFLPLYQT